MQYICLEHTLAALDELERRKDITVQGYAAVYERLCRLPKYEGKYVQIIEDIAELLAFVKEDMKNDGLLRK